MRDIVFRGKTKFNEWVEGDLIHDIMLGMCIQSKFRDAVLPDTVSQYTGLTDNTGKRIFEGDILECSDDIANIRFYAVVEFGNPNCGYDWGFQLRHLKGDKPNMDILCWVDMEEAHVFCGVVGNRWDDSELMSEVNEISNN